MNSCCSGLTHANENKMRRKAKTVQRLTHCQSKQSLHSINLLDCWTTGTSWWGVTIHTTTRHAALWTAACSLVHFHHDWVHDTLNLLLLRLELILLGKLVLVQPIQRFLNRLLNLVFVVSLEFVLQLLLL